MPKRLLRLHTKLGRPGWESRYDDLERRRAELLARLTRAVSLHNEEKLYRTARALLNEKFRAAKLAQRGAILASAEWLVGILETASYI